MAHTCPNCGCYCTCKGDWDDIDLGHEPSGGCVHYLDPDCDYNHEDNDEPEADEWLPPEMYSVKIYTMGKYKHKWQALGAGQSCCTQCGTVRTWSKGIATYRDRDGSFHIDCPPCAPAAVVPSQAPQVPQAPKPPAIESNPNQLKLF